MSFDHNVALKVTPVLLPIGLNQFRIVLGVCFDLREVDRLILVLFGRKIRIKIAANRGHKSTTTRRFINSLHENEIRCGKDFEDQE